jgi:hypothetical protein
VVVTFDSDILTPLKVGDCLMKRVEKNGTSNKKEINRFWDSKDGVIPI